MGFDCGTDILVFLIFDLLNMFVDENCFLNMV